KHQTPLNPATSAPPIPPHDEGVGRVATQFLLVRISRFWYDLPMIQPRISVSPTGKRARFSLVHRDCVQGMSELPEASVDVVVTSPPYNLGVQYGKYEDDQVREDYLEWSLKWASQVGRVLKEDGSFFLNVGAAPSNPLLPHQLILALTKLFVLQ